MRGVLDWLVGAVTLLLVAAIAIRVGALPFRHDNARAAATARAHGTVAPAPPADGRWSIVRWAMGPLVDDPMIGWHGAAKPRSAQRRSITDNLPLTSQPLAGFAASRLRAPEARASQRSHGRVGRWSMVDGAR
jgi:hypothetical protein